MYKLMVFMKVIMMVARLVVEILIVTVMITGEDHGGGGHDFW